uniref:Putative secreted protein n=1 Tax=Ixodes ricinus TaxID=34613 RepID=A0A6B0TZZ9_IXORI
MLGGMFLFLFLKKGRTYILKPVNALQPNWHRARTSDSKCLVFLIASSNIYFAMYPEEGSLRFPGPYSFNVPRGVSTNTTLSPR